MRSVSSQMLKQILVTFATLNTYFNRCFPKNVKQNYNAPLSNVFQGEKDGTQRLQYSTQVPNQDPLNMTSFDPNVGPACYFCWCFKVSYL